MRSLISTMLLSTLCLADQPAVAPQYEAPAATSDQYGAPSAPISAAAPAGDTYGAPAAAPVKDEYGSPQAPPVKQDSYGAPQAPVVAQDSYGSPQAPVETAAPVGNQGYYYYPVRQNAPAAAEESDDGLLGGRLLSALLGKKLLLVVLGVGAFLVITAFGLSFTIGGRRSLEEASSRALHEISPYMNEQNLVVLADYVRNAIQKYN